MGNQSVKRFVVRPVSIQEIKDFVENWHYSKNVNGITVVHCFGLYDKNNLIGAMIYGTLGMANAWKKYAKHEKDVLELRRLCCIDDTPKNTESYFIGQTLKYLRRETNVKTVVSYADTNYGHNGTIYKASNFLHVGMTAPGKIIKLGDRNYHDKAIRTYYINKLGVKTLKPFAVRLRSALENGEAYYEKTTPKHIYVYKLRK